VDITAEAPGTFTQDHIDVLVHKAAGNANSSRTWSWHSTGTLVELRADLPPVADPRRRSLLLEVGTALLNLRLLIKGLGVHPALRLFPDPGRRDLVATMALQGRRQVTEHDRVLTAAVLSGGRPVRPLAGSSSPFGELFNALRKAAKTEQAWLAAKPIRAVLPATSEKPDSAPEGSALIIGTVLDGSEAQVHAGQAAQRVLLNAAVLGAPVTPISDVLLADVNRLAVRALLGGGLWPQAVLRPDANRSV
jgi:hypothetical protein